MTRLHEKWLVLASPLILAVLTVGSVAGLLRVRSGAADDGGGGARGAEASARTMPVTVMTLGSFRPPPVGESYRGVVVPSKEAELSFRVAGRVESVAVDEGTHIARGDRLAALDTATIEAEIAASEAMIEEAEAVLGELVAGPRRQTIEVAQAEVRRLKATVELAESTVGRQRSLARSNAASPQQLDDATSNLEQQRAALAAAEQRLYELREGTRSERIVAQRARVASLGANLQSLRVRLDDHSIVAPFDGVVSRRYLDEGAIVGPDRRAVRVVQIDPLEARFGLAPDDAVRLRAGDEVDLIVDSVTLRGRIDRIEPEIDRATRTQAVFVTVPTGERREGDAEEAKPTPVPGRTLGLRLPVGGAFGAAQEEGWWVPTSALTRAGRGLWSLYVVVADGKGGYRVDRREVQVLGTRGDAARVNGSLVETGETIVASAPHRIAHGVRVEPVTP